MTNEMPTLCQADDAAVGNGGEAQAPANSGRGDIFDLVRRVAEGSIVLGALLFVAAWSFLGGYYHSGFGLSLGDIDFSAQVALIFSFPVILNWRFLLCLSMVSLVYTLARRYCLWMPSSLLVVILLALTANWVSYVGVQLGLEEAHLDMLRRSSRLPVVVSPSVTKDGLPLCPGSDLLLLVHSHGNYFVFEPSKSLSDDNRNLTVCVIPEGQVSSVSLQVGVREKK